MSNWYYALGDSEQGPIPAAELKALAVDGTIGPDTLVWKDGMPDWKKAAEIPGLLPSAGSAPAARAKASRSSAGRGDDHDTYDDNPYEDYGEAYEAPRRRSTRNVRHPDGAGVVLALGIISLVSCQLLGIAAWIMGNNYMSECKRMGVEPEGTAVAGRICGMIALGLMAFSFLIIFPLFCLGAAAGP